MSLLSKGEKAKLILKKITDFIIYFVFVNKSFHLKIYFNFVSQRFFIIDRHPNPIKVKLSWHFFMTHLRESFPSERFESFVAGSRA